MKNHWISVRIIAVLASFTLLLSACGGGGGSSSKESTGSGGGSSAAEASGMGRYVEEALTLPEDVGEVDCITRLEDGTLLMVSEAPQTNVTTHSWSCYESKDNGKTWTKRNVPFFTENPDNIFGSFQFDREGNLYAAYSLITPEYFEQLNKAIESGKEEDIPPDPPTVLGKIAPDGTFTALPIQWKADESGRASVYGNPLLTENGDLVVNHYSSIVVYDLQSGQVKLEIPCMGSRSIAVYGDTLGAVLEGNLQQYSLTTGDQLDSVPLDSASDAPILARGTGGDSLIQADNSGIYRLNLASDGSAWEQVMDGSKTSLAMPSVSVAGLVQLEEESFLLLIRSEDSLEASIFRYNPSVPSQPEQTLSVYSLKNNDTVRQAAGLFQRKHPETAVTYTAAITGDSSVTESDAIRSLNTELLAGKGPDVLVLDGLPIASYQEKGILADLSGQVLPKAESGDLLKNVVTTFETDGKLSAVPARFGVPVFYGPSEAVDSAKDFPALADWIAADSVKTGTRQWPYLHPSNLIRDFYYTCAPAWLAEDGSIQKEAFSIFLENIKKIADTAADPGAEQPVPEEENRSAWYSAIFAISWASEGAENAIRSFSMLALSADDLNWPDAAMKVRTDGKFSPLPGQAHTGKVFVPRTILGVNAGSALGEQAAELVETALSAPVQRLDFYDGLPVNTEAFQKSLENPFMEGDDGMQATIEVNGETQYLQAIWPDDAFMQAFQDLCFQLDTPSTMDPVLAQMIIDETAPYFSGEKDLASAVSAVMERTQAYLAE